MHYMQKRFGFETVVNLFIGVGSITACLSAYIAASLTSSDFKTTTMLVGVAGLVTAIAGLITSVGSQIVNILKVIKDHEMVTEDIMKLITENRILIEKLKKELNEKLVIIEPKNKAN